MSGTQQRPGWRRHRAGLYEATLCGRTVQVEDYGRVLREDNGSADGWHWIYYVDGMSGGRDYPTRAQAAAAAERDVQLREQRRLARLAKQEAAR